jgi:hypothetical protein
MANSWISFSNLPSATPAFNPDTMLLLTDGTVLVHNTSGAEWYRLAPDDNGDYDSGTWSGPFSMATTGLATATWRHRLALKATRRWPRLCKRGWPT